LKVEPAGNAVDVQHLTRKVQTGAKAAFHGLKIHIPQANAATGNKFFFKDALAANGIFALVQFQHQLLESRLRQVGPG